MPGTIRSCIVWYIGKYFLHVQILNNTILLSPNLVLLVSYISHEICKQKYGVQPLLTLGVVFGKEMEKLLKVVVFLFNKSWFAVVAILNASIVTLNFYHHIFLGEFNGLWSNRQLYANALRSKLKGIALAMCRGVRENCRAEHNLARVLACGWHRRRVHTFSCICIKNGPLGVLRLHSMDAMPWSPQVGTFHQHHRVRVAHIHAIPSRTGPLPKTKHIVDWTNHARWKNKANKLTWPPIGAIRILDPFCPSDLLGKAVVIIGVASLNLWTLKSTWQIWSNKPSDPL